MKVTSCLYCEAFELVNVARRSDDNGILKCNKCGLMMVENVSDNTESLYTADYFEKQVDDRSGYTDYLSSPVANLIGKYAFSRLFAQNKGKHLDLGCADGSLIEIFKSEGFESRGLEISKDAVKIAQSKDLNVTFSTLHLFPENLPKSNLITAFDLLEHADRPGLVLKEVYKNLEADGCFVFSTLSVKSNDPLDYWFSHSLEHYIYYDKQNLSYILEKIFGKGNYGFVEMEINGIAEFWGFAKKGSIIGENKIIEYIRNGTFDKKNPDSSYLLSLFYDQLSKFLDSQKIIEYFRMLWPTNKLIQASFYNNYYQGKYELAVNDSKKERYLMPATNSVYWQALCDAEEKLTQIVDEQNVVQYTAQLTELREKNFALKDELHTLKNSRLLGKIIKVRDKVGSTRTKLSSHKLIPKIAVRKIRVAGAPYVPPLIRKNVKKLYKKSRQVLKDNKVNSNITISTVAVQPWPKDVPLVSIVVPFYNATSTIDQTLNSLKDQTFKDYEITVVDDGSTDEKSVEKINELKQQNSYINFIKQENQGPAAARNTGVAIAKGKYVMCLDSDDWIEPTYVEKVIIMLETDPNIALVSSYTQTFGAKNENIKYEPYKPLRLFSNNMLIHAAAFRKEAWKEAGGYKSDIGYEDWEYWITLAEKGYWGKILKEPLFHYRVAITSRYVSDKDAHWLNLKKIKALHNNYKKNIRDLELDRKNKMMVIEPKTAFVNIDNNNQFKKFKQNEQNILITIPWMTFGGAETLIYNYCREIKDKFNISFVTGQQSEHEWEYKFREITPNIYHLANLFDDPNLHLEFISNYIKTRKIDVLHAIHNGFTYSMMPELKRRHPDLKIILTLFNDRVPEYVAGAIKYQQYINRFVTDNSAVAKSLGSKLESSVKIDVIPNGIDAYKEFSKLLHDRKNERKHLNIGEKELAVFFVGRLSEEKNPDVFIRVAQELGCMKEYSHVKFFMIGDGPMRPEIDKMIKEMTVDNMHYLGYQSEIARYLSAADMFVLPSKVEGFPLSILEAMSMGVAVIASDVGAVSEVIESGVDGYVVKPGSVEEIITCIKILTNDIRKLEEIKQSANDKVKKKYSNRILGDNYQNLYKEVVA